MYNSTEQGGRPQQYQPLSHLPPVRYKRCRKCGTSMPESYSACAYCHARFKKSVGIVSVLLGIFVLFPVMFFAAHALLFQITRVTTIDTDTTPPSVSAGRTHGGNDSDNGNYADTTPPPISDSAYPYSDDSDDNYGNYDNYDDSYDDDGEYGYDDDYGYDDYDDNYDNNNAGDSDYVLGRDDDGRQIYIYGEFTEDDIQYPSDVRRAVQGRSLAELLVSKDDADTRRIFAELYANKTTIELAAFYNVYDDIADLEADIAAKQTGFEEMTLLWGAWLDMSDPDYFPWKYSGEYYPDKHCYKVFAVDIQYRADAAKVKRELLASLNGVLAKIDTGWSPVDKLRVINDILCAQTEYGESDDDGGQTIYSALIEHKTVCAGYTRAYIVIAKALGIDARYIRGYAEGGPTGGSHAWLLARVAGRWYHIDPTWDDSTYSYTKGVRVRDYFLKGDTYMRESGHTSWDSGGIVCDGDYAGR